VGLDDSRFADSRRYPIRGSGAERQHRTIYRWQPAYRWLPALGGRRTRSTPPCIPIRRPARGVQGRLSYVQSQGAKGNRAEAL
jgi:hypothetical protein